MDMLDKRLNDKGKNWRHVFKALVVLDYLLHFGSENVVLYAKENVYVIKTLREFQHLDDAGRDVGHNVRQRANEVTSLILDDQRLRDERKSRHSLQDRVWSIDYASTALTRRNEPRYIDEERDLQRAIEESKRLAEIESKKRGDSDADLARAIEESEREAREMERKRREQLDKTNFDNLFGLQTSSPSLSNPFPTTQRFDPLFQSQQQQQQQILPQTQPQIQPQWPQSTGMSFADPITATQQQQQQQQNNPYYSSPLQAQITGYPTGYAYQNTLQAQMTGYPPQQTSSFSSGQIPQFQAQMTGIQNSHNPFGQMNAQTTGSAVGAEGWIRPSNGIDTFGNTGNLRIPFGTGFANTLATQHTSNNLFSEPIEHPSRNPFGTSNNKSLLELMQKQKLKGQQSSF
ncbi:Putative EH domain binding protein epsin 2 [Rhizopus microsporus]|nr:Putative EH domain binding protein epsin 2 [Rhizopus microsporus]